MNSLPPEIIKQMQEAIRRPEGTVLFEYHCKELFDKDKKGILFQIASGGQLFRLERDDRLLVHFYHSSPGTGTRVATIDLNKIPCCDQIFVCFRWSPTMMDLSIGPRVPNGELVSAIGSASSKQFRVGQDGEIYQIGDAGVEVMGVNVNIGGKQVLKPTALEAWKATLKAIDILGTGKSEEGYIFEIAVTNLSLAVLVTGFEAYTKERFLELEQEGIAPDIDALINEFFSAKDRESGILERLKSEAELKQKTILQLIVEKGTINFQNYDDCKSAYSKTYKIKFGDFNLPSNALAQIKKFIKYRHRIIHVSALIGMLNQAEVPPEEPVFPKKELIKEAINLFGSLIEELHNATLKLSRTD